MWYFLDQIFKVLGEGDISAKQIIPYLWLLYIKKWKCYCKHCQKTTNDLEKLIPDLSKEGKE